MIKLSVNREVINEVIYALVKFISYESKTKDDISFMMKISYWLTYIGIRRPYEWCFEALKNNNQLIENCLLYDETFQGYLKNQRSIIPVYIDDDVIEELVSIFVTIDEVYQASILEINERYWKTKRELQNEQSLKNKADTLREFTEVLRKHIVSEDLN